MIAVTTAVYLFTCHGLLHVNTAKQMNAMTGSSTSLVNTWDDVNYSLCSIVSFDAMECCMVGSEGTENDHGGKKGWEMK